MDPVDNVHAEVKEHERSQTNGQYRSDGSKRLQDKRQAFYHGTSSIK
jgi:hypothetical protein